MSQLLRTAVPQGDITAMSFDRSKFLDVDLFDPVLKSNPARTFVDWSTRPPFYVEVGGVPQAVVTRYEDAKKAFEDYQLFSNVKRPWPGTEKYYYWQGLPVVTDNDPPNHTRLRTLLSPAFSPRKLATVEAGIRSFVDTTVERIAAGEGGFDAVADLGHPLAAHILLGLLLELPEEDWTVFTSISKGLSTFANLPAGSAAPPEFLKIWERGRAYCDALIEARRKSPGTDLVSNIVTAHDHAAKLSTEELYATFIILYAGGLSSIISYISWTLWRLARDPVQLGLVQSDPALIADALAESLRTDPVGYTALRYATEDFEFAGLRLLPGMPVILIEGATNYDPRVYDNPLEFDLRRKQTREVLSFGSGVHRCIGASLAKMCTKIAITAVIQRFPKLRLADPNFWPVITGGPKERGPSTVPLRID